MIRTFFQEVLFILFCYAHSKVIEKLLEDGTFIYDGILAAGTPRDQALLALHPTIDPRRL